MTNIISITHQHRKRVHIVDQPCGTGKTSAMLNSFDPTEKYLVVVPYLSEVDRVIRDSNVTFVQPETDQEHATKSSHLEALLIDGVNVVTTHKLFTDISAAAHAGLVDEYNVIIDEVLDVVRGVDGISRRSFQQFYLKAGYAEEDSEGKITATPKWEWDFDVVSDTLAPGLFKLAKTGSLYRADGTFFLWALTPVLLRSAKSVTVYTYMAEGSVMLPYFRRLGIEYSHQVDIEQDREFRAKARRLIDLRPLPSLEGISFSYHAQTTGPDKASRDRKIANALKNLTRRELKGIDLDKVLITCAQTKWFHKGDKDSGKPAGFAKGSRFFKARWISNMTRGTNDHVDCHACVYLYDQYLNPYIKRWVGLGPGREADDRYAIAELIQWVYRSRVRRDEPITLFIASPRMRGLMEQWLDGEDLDFDHHLMAA